MPQEDKYMNKFVTKRLIPINRLNIYAEDKTLLEDMDLAILISSLIFEMLKKNIKPVLDFEGIEKISPYWLVLSLLKFILKTGGRVNEIIGVVNMSTNQLKLLNIVAKECWQNGEEILQGTVTSSLPNDDIEEL